MNTPSKYDIVAELLTALEAEGHRFGVDKHLQIQTLLKELPNDIAPQNLKLALIPLLAKSQSEQTKMYALFEAVVKNIEEKQPTLPPKMNLWKRFLTLIDKNRIVSILIFLLIAGWVAVEITNRLPKPRLDLTDKIKVSPPNSQPNDVIKELKYPFVENKPYPFPNHLTQYSYKEPPTISSWFKNNWLYLLVGAVLFLAALLFALWRYILQNDQKLVAEQTRNDKPPHFWNIKLEGVSDDIISGDAIEKVSTMLRRRSESDVLQIDMPRTIGATIEHGGFPIFKYKTRSAPTDYVLLIDRQTIRNHRAQLFDKLFQAFKEQEVEMARYFFDANIQVCFNENYPYGISLSEIQQKHYQARLIIISDGAQMLNPATANLSAWTTLFDNWKYKALLTPKPLKNWGYKENQLENLFTTLPATLQGLRFWVEELEAGADARFDTWREKIKDAPKAPINPDDDDPMPLLEMYFDTPILKWIAACAIYPTLHFDLTLWLGKEISGNTETLVNYDNLAQIFRLAWFVNGKMPDSVRIALVHWLETFYPEVLKNLRAALATELENNAPPTDSAAYDPFRMHIALLDFLSTDDKKKKKELEQEIEDLKNKGVEADVTVAKYLEKPPSALDTYLPEFLKKFIKQSKTNFLSTEQARKFTYAFLLSWLIGGIAIFWNYKIVQPNNKIVNLNYAQLIDSISNKKGLEYAGLFTTDGKNILTRSTFKNVNQWTKKQVKLDLNDARSNMAYNEQLMHDALLKNDFKLADSLNAVVGALNIQDSIVKTLVSERNKNIAVDYYLLAKETYDKNKNDTLVCHFLNIAMQLDSTDNDIKYALQIVCYKIMPAVGRFLEGLDISHFNSIDSRIDFDSIAKNFAFVYVKASEGNNLKDNKFIEFMNALGNRNVLRGAYHNFRIQNNDVKGQINNFLNAGIDYKKAGVLPPVLDIESSPTGTTNSGTLNNDNYVKANRVAIIEQIHTWLNEVEKATGKTPIIYTNQGTWDDALGSPTGFERYPLWIADYSTSATQPKMPLNWSKYLFWQYTENGVVNGKAGFDVNRTNLTYQDLINLTQLGAKAVIPNSVSAASNTTTTTTSTKPDTTLNIEMVPISAGTFDMGDVMNDNEYPEEKPVHKVTLDGFYLGKYEVTQAQWRAVMGNNPSSFKGDDLPVERVSWDDIQEFLQKLNAKSKLKYRLPTEAEWEYAAREGGKKVRFGNGKDIANPTEINFNGTKDYKAAYSEVGEYREKTTKVGSFKPNSLGLYDMSGNVLEWCSDWYGGYESAPQKNPQGPKTGLSRVLRGGSWYGYPNYCRVANRGDVNPTYRVNYYGFRLAR